MEFLRRILGKKAVNPEPQEPDFSLRRLPEPADPSEPIKIQEIARIKTLCEKLSQIHGLVVENYEEYTKIAHDNAPSGFLTKEPFTSLQEPLRILQSQTKEGRQLLQGDLESLVQSREGLNKCVSEIDNLLLRYSKEAYDLREDGQASREVTGHMKLLMQYRIIIDDVPPDEVLIKMAHNIGWPEDDMIKLSQIHLRDYKFSLPRNKILLKEFDETIPVRTMVHERA